MTLYALVVGIDDYQPPMRPLRGARRDALAVEACLRTRLPEDRLRLLMLTDADATRAAVIAGFRKHLGQAGPGDSALFWFSGHGSWLPVPPELAHLESTGTFQTLLCADSRQGSVPDLVDKEIALLIADVAATGAHVVVVLDSCHSDGGTRPDLLEPRLELSLDGAEPAPVAIGGDAVARSTPPTLVPPPVEALLAELQDLIGPGGPRADVLSAVDHVALAACGPHEMAVERLIGGHHRGVFTTVLLDRLKQQPDASYRTLLEDTRNLLAQMVRNQRPTLFPAAAVPGGGLADQPFLGGPALLRPTTMTMRFRNRTWILDAGACHGLVPGTAADPTVVGVAGSRPVRQARVVEVRAEHSVLEPIGWSGDAVDRRTGHPVVLTRVPLPAEAVWLETVGAGEYVGPLIIRTLAAAGEGGLPSPYARVLGPADRTRRPTVRIRAAGPGSVQLCRADGAPLAPPQPCRTPQNAARLVADLEHIARWRLVAGLDNPVSRLAGTIRLDVAAARPGQAADRLSDPPLPLLQDGSLSLDYRRAPDGGWRAPEVFLRLRSSHDRMLYCVLLDLTDRFRMHAGLFPGDWIGPHRTAWAKRGRAVRMALPPGREAVPGATATDWLKVLISETPVNAAPFTLPRLGEPVPPAPIRRSALTGVVDRLGLLARHRGCDPAEPAAIGDWAVATLRVTVRVPGPGPAAGRPHGEYGL